MATTPASSASQPVESAIRAKLAAILRPSALTISNDSWQHRHHAAMRDQDGGSGETHFSIQVVSEAFTGKSTMQRHRMIYAALSEELENGVHALSLHTKTDREVNKVGTTSQGGESLQDPQLHTHDAK